MVDMKKVFDTISINGIKYGDKKDVEKNLKKYSKNLKIDISQFIEPPPVNSDDTTLEEIKKISLTTNRATEEDIKKAFILDDKPHDIHEKFLKENGLKFPKKEFNTLWKTIGEYVMFAKWSFNRPRPIQLAEKFNIYIIVNDSKTAQTPSYPSGHTAYAKTSAMLLSQMYPEFTKNFEDAVDIVSQSRIILGLHYPSDCIAAEKLVDGLFKNLTRI